VSSSGNESDGKEVDFREQEKRLVSLEGSKAQEGTACRYGRVSAFQRPERATVLAIEDGQEPQSVPSR